MRRPARRVEASSVRLPAPVKGLMESQPAVATDPLGAEWLEGFVPTERGIRVRGGRTRAAFVTDPVKTLHPYVDATAPEFFAATANAIYNISSLNPTTAPAPAASGFASGGWSSQQVGTSGGDFLVMVNGSDPAQLYDGGTWNPLTDEAISDLDYDALSADFEIGETLTGGTSGATAEIKGVVRTSSTAGTLKLGTITGTFQDNETITSASGSATSDGTASSASSLTITGVATSALSHVWLYRERLFFVEKGTLKAWYLPAGAIGGAVSDINLAGVFRKGGSLLLGGTWSTADGAVLDDKCVFITTEGEVAIYSGSDPSSVADWGLQGRYDIGKPLGKRASITVGGDFLIATDDGIVPLSGAINRDPATMSIAMVTAPIRDTWTRNAREYGENVELLKWTDESLMLALMPGSSRLFTANLLTGAWATQQGWQGDCMAEYQGGVYVGRSDGRVYKIDDSGNDDGDTFVAQACFAFTDMGAPEAVKTAQMARASFVALGAFNYKISMAVDYEVKFPVAPSAAADSDDFLIWGSEEWGDSAWDSDADVERLGRVELWRSVTGQGYALAPLVQVASGNAKRVEAELLAIDLLIAGGGRAA